MEVEFLSVAWLKLYCVLLIPVHDRPVLVHWLARNDKDVFCFFCINALRNSGNVLNDHIVRGICKITG